MNTNTVITTYIRSLDNLSDKVILDIPCGKGSTTVALREKNAKVLSFDLFPEYFAVDGPVEYADLSEKLPVADNSVDIVIFQEGIEHLPNQLFALQEMARVLKQDGELWVTTPSISNLAGRTAQFAFEAQLLRGTPESLEESVWREDREIMPRKYYGHIFLIGINKLRTLLRIAGFRTMSKKFTEVSKSSLLLLPLLYPVIVLLSVRMIFRCYMLNRKNSLLLKEKFKQLSENLSVNTLVNKHLFIIAKK